MALAQGSANSLGILDNIMQRDLRRDELKQKQAIGMLELKIKVDEREKSRIEANKAQVASDFKQALASLNKAKTTYANTRGVLSEIEGFDENISKDSMRFLGKIQNLNANDFDYATRTLKESVTALENLSKAEKMITEEIGKTKSNVELLGNTKFDEVRLSDYTNKDLYKQRIKGTTKTYNNTYVSDAEAKNFFDEYEKENNVKLTSAEKSGLVKKWRTMGDALYGRELQERGLNQASVRLGREKTYDQVSDIFAKGVKGWVDLGNEKYKGGLNGNYNPLNSINPENQDQATKEFKEAWREKYGLKDTDPIPERVMATFGKMLYSYNERGRVNGVAKPDNYSKYIKDIDASTKSINSLINQDLKKVGMETIPQFDTKQPLKSVNSIINTTGKNLAFLLSKYADDIILDDITDEQQDIVEAVVNAKTQEDRIKALDKFNSSAISWENLGDISDGFGDGKTEQVNRIAMDLQEELKRMFKLKEVIEIDRNKSKILDN